MTDFFCSFVDFLTNFELNIQIAVSRYIFYVCNTGLQTKHILWCVIKSCFSCFFHITFTCNKKQLTLTYMKSFWNHYFHFHFMILITCSNSTAQLQVMIMRVTNYMRLLSIRAPSLHWTVYKCCKLSYRSFARARPKKLVGSYRVDR